jgi:hypothetical protein
MVNVVDKVKALWYEWIPGWLPIVLALCWMAMQYQHVNDRLDSLEKQMIDMQDYIRHEHQKTRAEPPDSELQLPQARPQDAGNSPAYSAVNH